MPLCLVWFILLIEFTRAVKNGTINLREGILRIAYTLRCPVKYKVCFSYYQTILFDISIADDIRK